MADGDLTLLKMMRRLSTQQAAREYFERIRWPNGPVCPHCGNADAERIYARTANKKSGVREGMYTCAGCRDTFTVTVGTVMARSHIPLNKWLIAFYMMCASKTQVSALQLQRQLELGSYRTALFLCQRIRYALADIGPSGKLGGKVEADETYVGGTGRGYTGIKVAVVSLVECDDIRSHVAERVSGGTIEALFRKHVKENPHLNTDESPLYKKAGKRSASHVQVNHSKEEYGYYEHRSGRTITTSMVEGFFGNAKRSLDGTRRNVSRQHLHRHTAERDFKYDARKTTDGERTAKGLCGIEGKRLMYRAKAPV